MYPANLLLIKRGNIKTKRPRLKAGTITGMVSMIGFSPGSSALVLDSPHSGTDTRQTFCSVVMP